MAMIIISASWDCCKISLNNKPKRQYLTQKCWWAYLIIFAIIKSDIVSFSFWTLPLLSPVFFFFPTVLLKLQGILQFSFKSREKMVQKGELWIWAQSPGLQISRYIWEMMLCSVYLIQSSAVTPSFLTVKNLWKEPKHTTMQQGWILQVLLHKYWYLKSASRPWASQKLGQMDMAA